MTAIPSIAFFDTQFQKQIAGSDFALNPFEQVALPFVHGRVLGLGCGLGNLAIEAARRGAKALTHGERWNYRVTTGFAQNSASLPSSRSSARLAAATPA